MWGNMNTVGNANFGHLDPNQSGWTMNSSYALYNAVNLTIPPGTVFKSSARNYFEFRDSTVANINGATFDNVRISYIQSASGLVQNTTFTSALTDYNPHIWVQTSNLTVDNSVFTATDLGVGRSDGIYINGLHSPVISNSTFENLRRAISLAGGATPVLTNNTFLTNVADIYP
jgi:parallel beta-helix repeat protein